MNKRKRATKLFDPPYNDNDEIWKVIPNTRGLYHVSNYGRVYRDSFDITVNDNGRVYQKPLPAMMCKMYRDPIGYPSICIFFEDAKRRVRVHRLVADAFVKKVDGKHQVNHLDGSKDNNYYKNLEWCTHKENIRHAHNVGLFKNPNSRKSIAMIDMNTNKIVKVFQHQSEAYEYLGVNKRGSISECCYGKRNHALSYKWRFIDEQTH